MSIKFICLLSALPYGSLAATLVADDKMMRREPVQSAVQLSSHGDLIATSKGPPNDFCKYDFPLGVAGSKATCTDTSEHHIILNEEMCIKAAQEAGASTPHATFDLDHWDFNTHPKGCFYKQGCSEDPKGNCYFFNGVDPMPTGSGAMQGTPVCSRDKYKNGTVDSAGAEEAGCATGYATIMDEAQCSAAAKCLGDCAGVYFRIGEANASRHLDFPQGCFIHKKMDGIDEQGCVYFNEPSPLGRPTGPKGTPICKVSDVNKFT